MKNSRTERNRKAKNVLLCANGHHVLIIITIVRNFIVFGWKLGIFIAADSIGTFIRIFILILCKQVNGRSIAPGCLRVSNVYPKANFSASPIPVYNSSFDYTLFVWHKSKFYTIFSLSVCLTCTSIHLPLKDEKLEKTFFFLASA